MSSNHQQQDTSSPGHVLALIFSQRPEVRADAVIGRAGWSISVPQSVMDGLRQVVLSEPLAVVAYLDGRDPADVDCVAALVAGLRRRRPGLPVIAVALDADDGGSGPQTTGAEQRLRIAGVTAYVSGCFANTFAIVAAVVQSRRPEPLPADHAAERVVARGGGVRSRAAPPARIRGRPNDARAPSDSP
jgi:hypothetical protein